MKTYSLILIVVLLTCLSLLIYWNTLSHQFVNVGDTSLIVQNPFIKSLALENIMRIFTPGTVETYQPICTLSYALDYYFWRLNPTGYHLTNIVCHTVNTLLVFLMAYLLSRTGWFEILPNRLLLISLAALIFAVHPIHVEAVAWVSGRCEVLTTTFTLASLSCFFWIFSLKTQSRRWIQPIGYGLSLMFLAAGVFTKPSVVILPLLNLSLLKPDVLTALAVLGITAILTLLAWKRSEFVFLGIVWFFVSVLPVTNIIPIATIKADRYLYLPSAGFCLVLAWLIVRGEDVLTRVVKTRLVRIGYWAIISVVIISYSFQTVQRNRDWKDSHTLWSATLEITPDSSIALNNLGLIYTRQGEYEKAQVLYEQSINVRPDQEHVEAVYVNMAENYAAQQMFDEAIEHYQHALETNPEYVEAYLGLASMSIQLQQYAHAEQIYAQALELDRQQDRIYTRLGNLYALQNKHAEAQAYFQKALNLNPFDMNAYNGMGLSYARSGDVEKALELYQHALTLDPDVAILHNSLGSLYLELGQTEKAIAAFMASLNIEPENNEVRNNLGIVYLQTGRYEDAARAFMTALTYQPNHAQILSHLGIAYTHLGLYEQAIQMYQWAIESDASFVQAHVLLGDVCLGTGQIACAREAYQNALQLQPHNHDILDKLETIKSAGPGE